MLEYKIFKDIGLNAAKPDGFKNIHVHFVYNVKHDGWHQARLVAGRHLTDIPVDSVYSKVVSLRGFKLLVFIAKLNNMEIWVTDISSAYLEAYTKEKVCIIVSPEFGALNNYCLVIDCALYSLKSSRTHWHDKFSSCMRAESFFHVKQNQTFRCNHLVTTINMLQCT